jgi:tripeptidyl-peptidase-1
MYNITYIVPDGISASRLGIAGFLEQYPNAEAVHNFLAKHSPRRNASDFSPSYNFTVEAINGGNDTDTGFGVEAILDTEYTMAFTQPLNITYYSTAGRGPDTGTNGTEVGPENTLDEPWIEFLEHMLTKDDASLPQVLSISYTDNEQQIPRPYATRVCDLFMQLTSRGVSVLIASGDGGAAGAGRQECYANDGTQQKVKFIPTFPVGCPYITSVGSTGNYFPTEPSSFSSGGFSDYFARPAWQEDAAHAYIKSLNGSHDGFYNASGRGIPDVSAVGSRFLVAAGGFEWQQSGTSASTPVWAAIIALINDKRLRAGKPVLGFLNPILYSADVSAAFKDVVQGFSASCTWGSNVESGWEAKSGWDPATGLGTPNFQRLLEILG